MVIPPLPGHRLPALLHPDLPDVMDGKPLKSHAKINPLWGGSSPEFFTATEKHTQGPCLTMKQECNKL